MFPYLLRGLEISRSGPSLVRGHQVFQMTQGLAVVDRATRHVLS